MLQHITSDEIAKDNQNSTTTTNQTIIDSNNTITSDLTTTINTSSANNNTNMASSLSSPNSLIINEESPPSLSSVSSPSSLTASSPQSSCFKSTSSRSASPISNHNHKKSDSDSALLKENTSSNTSSNNSKNDDDLTVNNVNTKLNEDYLDKNVVSIIIDSPTTECSEEQNDNKPASNKRTRNDSELENETAHVKMSRQTTNDNDDDNNKLVVDEKTNDSLTTATKSSVSSSQDDTKPIVQQPVAQQPQPQPDKYESMQPRLKKFLKIYQLSSRNSLSGPTQNDIDNSLTHANATTTSTPTNPTTTTTTTTEETTNITEVSTPPIIVTKSEPISSVETLSLLTTNQTALSAPDSNNLVQYDQNEHNNLAIIANVAAAAAAAAALNKEQQQKYFLNSVNGSQITSSNGLHHHHHHRHHNHAHKRAKYSNGSTPLVSTNNSGSPFKLNDSNPSSRSNSVGLNGQSSSLNREQQHYQQQNSRTNNNSANYLKCIQADLNTSPLIETLLHGERISCFIVGGEKRLCLHDILNTILKDFSVQQINNACQKLQIACLESSSKQLEILKKSHLLPPGAPNCGLLTQTNAERLCAYLMDSSLSIPGPPTQPPPQSTSPSSVSSLSSSSSSSSSSQSLSPSAKKNTLKVVHECFGKTYGHIHMHMYSRSDAACVECDTCRKLYTPKNFVCHTHKYEANTRHWGFDSSNWRIYLKLVQTSVTNSETKGILSDIKISNKDNIAANTKVNNPLNEEFELFKRKFLNTSSSVSSSSSQSTTNSSYSNDMLKRKSFCESDYELKKVNNNSQLSNKIEQNSENLNKRLINQSCSLNDLNNHLITTLTSSNGNANGPLSPHQSNNKMNGNSNNNIDSKSNNNSNKTTSIGEHKLLNGLLSKPLNTQSNESSSTSSTPTPAMLTGLSQQNLLIPTGSVDHLIKSSNNKLINSTPPTNRPFLNAPVPKYMMNDEFAKAAAAAAAASNPSSLLFYNLLNSSSGSSQSTGAPPNKLKDMRNSNSIEMNMLEIILNEIDACVENKESAERLRQMVTQLHIYFSDKLNESHIVKSKLLSEFDEFKSGFQNENEQLRCQLKLFHLQNELTKEHYLKSNPNLLQQQQQQQQQTQLIKTNLNNSNPNKSPNNNMMSASQFQNMFLMQQQHQHQQQQQQQQQKNQELQSAAAAAVQSFPQFFLNHYVPNLTHRPTSNPQSLNSDPLTSTPKKSFISSSAYSSPNSTSSSSSNSANVSFSNSSSVAKLQANASANNLILSLAAKCEPTHHAAV